MYKKGKATPQSMLIVPFGTKVLYKATSGWRNFGTIEEITIMKASEYISNENLKLVIWFSIYIY